MSDTTTRQGMATQRARDGLIERVQAAGIRDPRVLEAMAETPRDFFVDEVMRHRAYEDRALPIGYGQTISQPLIVAMMTEALMVKKPRRVLEIGTGSGYQTAVLARLIDLVFSVERIEGLAILAEQRLQRLGLTNVQQRHGDGNLGWRFEGPFDGIIVTAGADEIPEALMEQLTDGGRLVIPVGEGDVKELKVLDRSGDAWHQSTIEYVRFVPLKEGVQ